MRLGIFAILLAFASPLAAATLKAVPPRLNPAKAYVLIEYRSRPVTLPGSLRKYLPLQGFVFARYDTALRDIRGYGRASSKPLPKATDAFEPFKNKAILEEDGRRLFLLEMEPDDWVIEGIVGTAFSLGSYGFKLEPGTIVDLGVVSSYDDWPEGEHAPTLGDIIGAGFAGPFGKPIPTAPSRAEIRPRGDQDMKVPAGLAGITTIQFTPDQKFGNYLNGLVNRIEGTNYRAKAASSVPTDAAR